MIPRPRAPVISLVVRDLLDNEIRELQTLTHRVFVYLLLGQWGFAIACAAFVSPYTWSGEEKAAHLHLILAIALGGVLVSLPLYLIRVAPRSAGTRLTVATAQVLFSSLLIHLMGGRIEAHFHVFGSLALLSFYRDPWVFLPAVAFTFIDHLARGVVWPESVFGVDTPSMWRALEHAGWVLFETAFLLWGVAQSRGHLLKMATLQASVESERDTLEERVNLRTRELRDARDYFQNILDSLDAHVGIVDHDGVILSTNRAWRDSRELNESDPQRCNIGDNCLAVYRKADAARREDTLAIAEAIDEVIAGRSSGRVIEYACHHGETRAWFQARVSPFVNDNNAAAVIAHVDITDRVLATEAMKRESEKSDALARIIREAPNEIYIVDQTSLRFVDVNDGACAASGYSREELLSMTPMDLNPSLLEPQLREEIAPLQSGHAAVIELQTAHHRKDGSQYPVQISIHTANLNGLPVYVVFVSDVTDVQRLESQLSHAQKLESIGQLAAGIAHEINTPMQCVAMNVEFLAESNTQLINAYNALTAQIDGPAAGWQERREAALETRRSSRFDYLTEQIPAALDEADSAAKRVVEIVRAMRAMSHPGTAEKTLLDINELIHNAATISRSRWKDFADVRFELGQDLAAVPGFGAEISQVFLNLIVNAADAIAEKLDGGDGDLGVITIRTRQSDQLIRIEVEDTGTGMPEEVRARVFDPFFTTKDVGEGTGQGLSITHGVVVGQHGGTIDILTTEGEGTTFVICLPLEEPESLEAEAAPINAGVVV